MALYHFNVDQISRGGKNPSSAISAATYRAGEHLHSDYYGEENDYSRRKDVVCNEMMLPDFAPERFRDRETLWNELEHVEKHPKAQLAYSLNITLQNELSMEENIRIAREFCMEQFVSKGMIVDFAVHRGDKHSSEEPDNPHFHVMAPIRPLKENGDWDSKQHREYILDDEVERVLDTNGKPKFNAVPNTDWGDPETLKQWRRAWADKVNQTFKEHQIDKRIDDRSYEEQGLDLVATLHEGPAVRAMEEKGIHTEIGDLNRKIKFFNAIVIKLRAVVEEATILFEAAREELRRRKDPTLYDLIQEYYDKRNEVAKGYAYGTQKAEITNLKSYIRVVEYLKSQSIYDVDTLQKRLDDIRYSVSENKGIIQEEKKELGAVQQAMDAVKIKKQHQPVMDKYNKIYFKIMKDKFYNEHKKEINSYRRANRILNEYQNEHGKLSVTDMKAYVEMHKSNINRAKDTLPDMEKELDMLEKVNGCISEILEDHRKEDWEEYRNQQAQKQSIREKLEQTKTQQQAGRKKKSRGGMEL